MDVTPKSTKGKTKKTVPIKKKKLNLSEDLPEQPSSIKQESVAFEETPPRKVITASKKSANNIFAEWQYHGKFNDSETHVVWGSPGGSPSNSVRRIIVDPTSPKTVNVQNTSQGVNQVAENCISIEEPQFLSELVAISEKYTIKEESPDKVQESLNSEEEIHESVSANMCNKDLNESYSSHFDEDMNECMLRCSQEVEEKFLKSHESSEDRKVDTNGTINHNKDIKDVTSDVCQLSSSKVSVKIISESVKDSRKQCMQNIRKSPRTGNKNFVYSKCSENKYYFQGRAIGPQRKDKPTSYNSKSISGPEEKIVIDTKENESKTIGEKDNKSVVLKYQNKTCVTYNKSDSDIHSSINVQKKTDMGKDSSFEKKKQIYLENDLDIICTVPVDSCNMLSSDTKIVNNSVNINQHKKQSVAGKQNVKCNNNSENFNNDLLTLEDSLFSEPTVLKLLENVESKVPMTIPIKCTPEEIEKKRLEAKLKLQKKHCVTVRK